MADLLSMRPATLADAVDLIRGALDAHLHPPSPSRVPGLAAVTAGASWTVVALGVLAEPVPPDWPGLLAWTLPAAVSGVAAGVVAVAGIILANGPARGPLGRAAVRAGLLGTLLLLVALTVALLGGPYGAMTGAALSIAGVCSIAAGVVIVRHGAAISGELLIVAGAAWLLPPPLAWIVAGAAWTTMGLWMLADRAGRRPSAGIGVA